MKIKMNIYKTVGDGDCHAGVYGFAEPNSVMDIYFQDNPSLYAYLGQAEHDGEKLETITEEVTIFESREGFDFYHLPAKLIPKTAKNVRIVYEVIK